MVRSVYTQVINCDTTTEYNAVLAKLNAFVAGLGQPAIASISQNLSQRRITVTYVQISLAPTEI